MRWSAVTVFLLLCVAISAATEEHKRSKRHYPFYDGFRIGGEVENFEDRVIYPPPQEYRRPVFYPPQQFFDNRFFYPVQTLQPLPLVDCLPPVKYPSEHHRVHFPMPVLPEPIETEVPVKPLIVKPKPVPKKPHVEVNTPVEIDVPVGPVVVQPIEESLAFHPITNTGYWYRQYYPNGDVADFVGKGDKSSVTIQNRPIDVPALGPLPEVKVFEPVHVQSEIYGQSGYSFKLANEEKSHKAIDSTDYYPKQGEYSYKQFYNDGSVTTYKGSEAKRISKPENMQPIFISELPKVTLPEDRPVYVFSTENKNHVGVDSGYSKGHPKENSGYSYKQVNTDGSITTYTGSQMKKSFNPKEDVTSIKPIPVFDVPKIELDNYGPVYVDLEKKPIANNGYSYKYVTRDGVVIAITGTEGDLIALNQKKPNHTSFNYGPVHVYSTDTKKRIDLEHHNGRPNWAVSVPKEKSGYSYKQFYNDGSVTTYEGSEAKKSLKPAKSQTTLIPELPKVMLPDYAPVNVYSTENKNHIGIDLEHHNGHPNWAVSHPEEKSGFSYKQFNNDGSVTTYEGSEAKKSLKPVKSQTTLIPELPKVMLPDYAPVNVYSTENKNHIGIDLEHHNGQPNWAVSVPKEKSGYSYKQFYNDGSVTTYEGSEAKKSLKPVKSQTTLIPELPKVMLPDYAPVNVYSTENKNHIGVDLEHHNGHPDWAVSRPEANSGNFYKQFNNDGSVTAYEGSEAKKTSKTVNSQSILKLELPKVTPDYGPVQVFSTENENHVKVNLGYPSGQPDWTVRVAHPVGMSGYSYEQLNTDGLLTTYTGSDTKGSLYPQEDATLVKPIQAFVMPEIEFGNYKPIRVDLEKDPIRHNGYHYKYLTRDGVVIALTGTDGGVINPNQKEPNHTSPIMVRPEKTDSSSASTKPAKSSGYLYKQIYNDGVVGSFTGSEVEVDTKSVQKPVKSSSSQIYEGMNIKSIAVPQVTPTYSYIQMGNNYENGVTVNINDEDLSQLKATNNQVLPLATIESESSIPVANEKNTGSYSYNQVTSSGLYENKNGVADFKTLESASSKPDWISKVPYSTSSPYTGGQNIYVTPIYKLNEGGVVDFKQTGVNKQLWDVEYKNINEHVDQNTKNTATSISTQTASATPTNQYDQAVSKGTYSYKQVTGTGIYDNKDGVAFYQAAETAPTKQAETVSNTQTAETKHDATGGTYSYRLVTDAGLLESRNLVADYNPEDALPKITTTFPQYYTAVPTNTQPSSSSAYPYKLSPEYDVSTSGPVHVTTFAPTSVVEAAVPHITEGSLQYVQTISNSPTSRYGDVYVTKDDDFGISQQNNNENLYGEVQVSTAGIDNSGYISLASSPIVVAPETSKFSFQQMNSDGSSITTLGAVGGGVSVTQEASNSYEYDDSALSQSVHRGDIPL